MKRLVLLLLALVATLSMVTAPPVAADGVGRSASEFTCEAVMGPGIGVVADSIAGEDLCGKFGKKVEQEIKKEFEAVWDSVLGDVIKSAVDLAKWLLKKTLTLGLEGPSLSLAETGLFGKKATLAGMLVWLGWVIAAFGLMWQLGKMAVTGQMKYAGQALVGWVQNALLTGIGLTIVAVLLRLGDEMTTGLVDATFREGDGYERILLVMVPQAVANPVLVLTVVGVVLLVGFIQLVLIFLRQSVIPIQCLLLPIAGAGRVGGEVTRQWAPRLITSILVVIAYKPLLAVILCVGFTEFGKAHTPQEWLRGMATLVLGILAPGPLMKVFAPIGAEVGAGLSAGGAIGAAANIGSLVEQRRSHSSRREVDEGGAEVPSAVKQAQHLSQTMPKTYRDDGSGQDSSGGGGEAVAQAGRTGAAARVPVQAGPAQAASAGGAGVGGGAAASGGPPGVGLALQVLDGVNDGLQQAAHQVGDGGVSGGGSSGGA